MVLHRNLLRLLFEGKSMRFLGVSEGVSSETLGIFDIMRTYIISCDKIQFVL